MSKSPLAARYRAGDLPGQIRPDVSLTLFRILQEALHNSAKHSGVDRLDVRLRAVSGWIHLDVSDRGQGFDVESIGLSGGIELISMRERIKLVKGSLLIQSQPGRGTTLRASVPAP